ncbi:hypothetical protein BAUCODRAFT_411595 [Baudoinia panamericana UAMH 10762]|uniref:Uncharacterized protein n=1 Tax=Baudoinia panamericana (strain UAMH 10762) TaxID=717646 RepID=M2MMZ7_BAUPA|nr:uncharacterized protein BAUCODRAFT_411595 [Baudoinia panamericana UAMH 10762]EMC98046.1 hypothetical protein BAUCODRAFT_411595 [Baudoinia panamericana UAMH 10762]
MLRIATCFMLAVLVSAAASASTKEGQEIFNTSAIALFDGVTLLASDLKSLNDSVTVLEAIRPTFVLLRNPACEYGFTWVDGPDIRNALTHLDAALNALTDQSGQSHPVVKVRKLDGSVCSTAFDILTTAFAIHAEWSRDLVESSKENVASAAELDLPATKFYKLTLMHPGGEHYKYLTAVNGLLQLTDKHSKLLARYKKSVVNLLARARADLALYENKGCVVHQGPMSTDLRLRSVQMGATGDQSAITGLIAARKTDVRRK